MSRRRQVWAVSVVLAGVAACAAPSGLRPVPSPPLPTDVLPGGGGDRYPVEVVSAEARFAFAADGTVERTHTLRYRVRTLDELGPWAAVSATWAPWFQARPEVSAKVTRRGGASFELDPGTISEAPVESGQRGLYTDRRRLEAPLPGLAVGALVEHTVVVRDKRPFLPGGSLARHYFGLGAPVPRSTVIVEVPEGVPLTYQVRGLEVTPVEAHEAGRTRLEFEATDVPAQGPTRLLLPPENPRHAHLLMSTVPSWARAAGAYAKMVEGQLEGADVSSLLSGLDRARPRLELVRELLARMHGEIRYTGLELGEQAILPSPPAETLGRRFGDCKDKGVLLVALLRAVGIEAHLALLRSGFGEDVVPEVPGLELFDHAIVYLPGDTPLWIDATEELLPVGDLPDAVQGRYALVVAEGGPGLVRVPEAEPAHNRYLEVRKVTFEDWGPVNVVERTEATGSMEHRLRQQLLGAGRSQVEASLSRYVQRAYRSERIGRFQYGQPRDVASPFAVEVEALEARIGYTARTEAKVQLRTPVLFGFVPDLLRDAALGSSPENRDRELAAAAALVRTRATDLVLPRAFVAEVRYQLVLPEGFEVAKAPEPIRVTLGPGAYAVEIEDPKDGSLWATLSLRTGKRRYTADEARAFVAGLGEVWQMAIPTVELVHSGAKLMEAGTPKAAMAAYRGLVEAHPDAGSHRARYAEALLELGLGEAARAQAKAAARLAPKVSAVLMALGHVLEADQVGRPRAPGFDREGALAAFDAVIALDGEHVGARLARARLLELDDEGRPSRDASAWRAAAEGYRAARDITGDTELDARLMLAMYWGEDFEGLHRLASGLSPQAPNVAMQLVATAKLRGPVAALAELSRLDLDKDARQEALETAALSLARLRAYPEARALTQAALPTARDGVALQRRLATLSEVKQVSSASIEADTPEGAVRRLLYAMLDPPLAPERVEALFAARALDARDRDADLLRLTEGLSVFSRSAGRADVPIAMVRDNLLSATRFEVEGDPKTGFRVRGQLAAGTGERESVWFVVKERGAYRVRASSSVPSALGEEALDHLEGRRIAAGRRWLDWAEDAAAPTREQDALGRAPFVALRAAKAPLIVQAAALTALGPSAERAIRHLERAKDALTSGVATAALEHALWMANKRAERPAEAAAAAERLFALLPDSPRAFWIRCESLVAAGEAKAARKLASSRLRSRADDDMALGCLSEAEMMSGDVAAARRWLRKQADGGAPDPVLLNNLAWLALFEGKVAEADVEAALRSNVMTGFEDPAKLHTLAALYAEQGRLREAHQLLVKRLDLQGADAPGSVDWYLVGRIMEHLELFDLAKQAYGRVEPEAREVDSTHRLARARIAVIEGRTSKGAR